MTDTAEGSPSLHDILLKSQKEFLKNWADSAKQFYGTLGNGDLAKKVPEKSQDVFNAYSAWREGFGEFLDVLTNTFPMNTVAGTIPKLAGGADISMRLYKFWEPLLVALQEQSFDADKYKNLLDPGKYDEIIDKMFGFGSPDSITDLYQQTSAMVETWGTRTERIVKPWADAMRENADALSSLASGDPEARKEVFDNLYTAFEKSVGKVLNMPAVGKDRELTELILQAIHRYNVFLARNSEFQHEIHKVGQHAMEKVVEVLTQKVRDGEQIEGIEEFTKIWTSTNEKAYLELFNTEQFAELQGVLLEEALDARRYMHRVMEHCFEELPIALRSEMDDLYKTVHTLRKTVRAMQHENHEAEQMRKEMKRLEERVAYLEDQQEHRETAGQKSEASAAKKAKKKNDKRANQ